MNPGRMLFMTRALGAPADWDSEKQGECEVLEIRDRDGVMESAWYPTDQEKAAIATGRPVILTVWGSTHPPVSLNVEPHPTDCICPCRNPGSWADEVARCQVAAKCKCRCHASEKR